MSASVAGFPVGQRLGVALAARVGGDLGVDDAEALVGYGPQLHHHRSLTNMRTKGTGMDLTPCPACGGSREVVNGFNGSVTWCQMPHENYTLTFPEATPNASWTFAPTTGAAPSPFAGYTLPNVNGTNILPLRVTTGYGSGTAR